MKRNYQLFIQDIISAIDQIEIFVGRMAVDQLKHDDKTSSAVIRKFEIIGEAANRIDPDFREKNPEIEWNRIRGFRNRIIHDYFGIDYELLIRKV